MLPKLFFLFLPIFCIVSQFQLTLSEGASATSPHELDGSLTLNEANPYGKNINFDQSGDAHENPIVPLYLSATDSLQVHERENKVDPGISYYFVKSKDDPEEGKVFLTPFMGYFTITIIIILLILSVVNLIAVIFIVWMMMKS